MTQQEPGHLYAVQHLSQLGNSFEHFVVLPWYLWMSILKTPKRPTSLSVARRQSKSRRASTLLASKMDSSTITVSMLERLRGSDPTIQLMP